MFYLCKAHGMELDFLSRGMAVKILALAAIVILFPNSAFGIQGLAELFVLLAVVTVIIVFLSVIGGILAVKYFILWKLLQLSWEIRFKVLYLTIIQDLAGGLFLLLSFPSGQHFFDHIKGVMRTRSIVVSVIVIALNCILLKRVFLTNEEVKSNYVLIGLVSSLFTATVTLFYLVFG